MLVVQLLNSSFNLFYFDSVISKEFLTVKGEKYNIDISSKHASGFVGFFDWLRSDANSIVGIRISFFSNLPYNEILKKYSYVTASNNDLCMEILFSNNKYIPELSGDQDFGNNYVYNSSLGNYLFTFPLDHLLPDELRGLTKYSQILEFEN